ncbi:MAG: glycosyltransferase family 4 protein [Chloroflexota bacterium]
MTRPVVLLLTNTPAPYRLPVFAALAEQVALTVLYCEPQQPDRLWQVDLDTAVSQKLLTHRTVNLPGLSLTLNPGLAQQLTQIPFDVAIAGENFSHFPAVIALQRAARQQKRPFGLWSEAIDTAYASGHLLSNLYRRWLYGRTAGFLAYSEAAKQFLLWRGAPEETIVRGYQIVPPQQLPAPSLDRASLGLSDEQVVLYVGYFNMRKGLDLLLRAFQQVAQANDRLVLLGDGPEKSRLQQLAAKDGRILFPGYLEGAQKSSWYAASDLFVLPTRHDPWGLVVNEAMAFGLPIITTTAAGCAELVQENGIVVPADNLEALARALTDLLANPAKRATMGQQSRERIAPYTVSAARDAFLQLINYLLK